MKLVRKPADAHAAANLHPSAHSVARPSSDNTTPSHPHASSVSDSAADETILNIGAASRAR